MVDKTKLKDMLDSMIDDNSEQAETDFHSYLEDKMKDVVNPVADVEEVDKDESKSTE